MRKIYSLLKQHGHSITADWTVHQGVEIPERDTKSEICREYAQTDVAGVRKADVFILLTEPAEGRAKYAELGVAMQSCLESGKPSVYVVGKKLTSPFFITTRSCNEDHRYKVCWMS